MPDVPTIPAALQNAKPGDTIQLPAGYSPETATVTHKNVTIFGPAGSVGIPTLTVTAPIADSDARQGNGIVGNAGDNLIKVSGGIAAVDGGLDIGHLIADHSHAVGAVTSHATTNVSKAGNSGRSIMITTGTGNDQIRTVNGRNVLISGFGRDLLGADDGNDRLFGVGVPTRRSAARAMTSFGLMRMALITSTLSPSTPTPPQVAIKAFTSSPIRSSA